MGLAFLTFMIFFVLAGGESDIFRLDTDVSQPPKSALEQINTGFNFRLEKILTGNFQIHDGANVVLLEKHSDFSSRAEKHFRIRYARLNYNEIQIANDGISFNGTVANLVIGDIDGNGFDEIVLHWIDAIGREWIQVVKPSGFADNIFPPHRVTANRKEEVALADMNGDGQLEIVVPSFQKTSEVTGIDKIIVYFYQEESSPIIESYALIPAPVIDLIVADINGDGIDEIVTLRSVQHNQYSQAIWAITRRDDGSYTERPLAMGNSMTLVPPPLSGGRLYYTKKSAPSGRYFNIITTLEFEGNSFSNVNECRLIPEGLILEQVWGRFQPESQESLALIKDESMIARRWMLIYTPYESGRIANRIELKTNSNFLPNGTSAVTLDLNNDDIDELIYVSTTGQPFLMNLADGSVKTLNILD